MNAGRYQDWSLPSSATKPPDLCPVMACQSSHSISSVRERTYPENMPGPPHEMAKCKQTMLTLHLLSLSPSPPSYLQYNPHPPHILPSNSRELERGESDQDISPPSNQSSLTLATWAVSLSSHHRVLTFWAVVLSSCPSVVLAKTAPQAGEVYPSMSTHLT